MKMGSIGNGAGADGVTIYNTNLFLVPSGSTYQATNSGAILGEWHEAKMPVAVGTGGKTVKVLANLPADISSPLDEWIKLPLESDDEGFDNSTHRYKPTVAGWYSFQGQVTGLGINTGISCKIVRNFDSGTYDPDKDEFLGLTTSSDSTHPARSVNALFYLNGKDDYVELQGYNKQTAGYQGSSRKLTSLQGFLISGGSSSGGGGTPSSFARIVDKKPKTVAGGSSVAGIQVRDLNTIEYDNDNIVTLDGNDFTLQAGTYVINYSAPANRVEAHNANLFDVTDNQTVNTGTANYSLDNASNTSYGNYSVTLTEPHTYRVTHNTEVAKSSSGLGNLNPVNDGIFTTVDIQKVGTGGASSGATGGSGWEEKVLFENETGVTNFALSESYDGYDYLRFDTKRTDGAGSDLNRSDMIPVDKCYNLCLDNYSSLHMYYSCADTINFTCTSNTSVAMVRVVGIKTGTGGGSGGDSIWTQDGVIATHEGVVRADRNGNKINLNPDMSNGGTKAIIDSTLPMHFEVNGNEAMVIKSDGLVGILNIRDTVQTPNVYVDGGGDLYKSTTATYSAEEVDKKLAIKDKLIEKLSARLDDLEKKVK
jgi:hypothetical protein